MANSSTPTALLVIGYVLSVPFSIFLPGFLRLWRRREPALLVIEELGVAAIVAGWALRGERIPALLNAGWGVGLLVAWVREGRKRQG
jgi:hypothetical protein